MNATKRRAIKRPIVCGTDFSATATEAVDFAAAMARRLETRLVLVHVEQLVGVLAASPTALEAAISLSRVEMDDEVRRLRDGGTEVDEKFVSGSPFDQLVTAATKSNAPMKVWSTSLNSRMVATRIESHLSPE